MKTKTSIRLFVSIIIALLISMLFTASTFAQMTQITDCGAIDPAVSPDGEWIAFQLIDSGIAKIKTDGTHLTYLTDFGFQPDWSNVSNLIVFWSGDTLYTVHALTSEVNIVRIGGFTDNPAWAFDGNDIVAHSEDGIVMISYPEGNITNVPCTEPDETECEGESPNWSPYGSHIIFKDGSDVLKVSRSGGNAQVIAEFWDDVDSPVWSSNEIWIAVSTYDDYFDSYNISAYDYNYYCHVYATDDEYNDFNPCWWLPNDHEPYIFFDSDRNGNREIWRSQFDYPVHVDDNGMNQIIDFDLYQNKPNPFNAQTTISFYLNESNNVVLDIYNLLGQKVETLVEGRRHAGEHSVNWDGSGLSSGIYFYKLTTGDKVFTKRMTLLK
ncbi:MAG: T9SS type A sorting domain-containing protein [candidate division Zixibacteria bacterium]|nr:T9SS type A sorting domain-containing protein [candidate division Zixibacteria bacterium]